MGILEALIGPPEIELSEKFRTQIALLLLDAIGKWMPHEPWYDEEAISNLIWKRIRDTMRRKLGKFQLAPGGSCAIEECLNFATRASEDELIMFIETCFFELDQHQFDQYRIHRGEIKLSPCVAKERLNAIFTENQVPYSWSEGKLAKLDAARTEKQIEPLSTHAVKPNAKMKESNAELPEKQAEQNHTFKVWFVFRLSVAISIATICGYYLLLTPTFLVHDFIYTWFLRLEAMAFVLIVCLFLCFPNKWVELLISGLIGIASVFVPTFISCHPPLKEKSTRELTDTAPPQYAVQEPATKDAESKRESEKEIGRKKQEASPGKQLKALTGK